MNRVWVIMRFLILGSVHTSAQEYERAIEDNSFLIEEAFNQEDRVVQHISNAFYLSRTRDLLFSFTQEWPLGSQAHQLSYTIPYLSMRTGNRGIGDILLNYRYQLSDDHRGWGHVAPRISVILPTGRKSQGLGDGSPGLQVNLPVSKRWTNDIIAHLNAGAMLLFEVEGESPLEPARNLFSYFVGASGIYLLQPNLNLMLELLLSDDAGIEDGDVVRQAALILNPGFRFALDAGNLQIVPGFAMPIQFSSGPAEVGFFAYLSLEHPF
jgi:hypothetical protein